MLQVIAFDADDTLWHNETLFSASQQKFRELLLHYHEADYIDRRLYETERRNLELFGFGIKGFTLSMIETAIDLTEGRIGGNEIQEIVDIAKEMLRAPVEPLPEVKHTLHRLAESHRLMVITKGDLFDQEAKIARSGLSEYFRTVEIVSQKTPETYRAILAKHDIRPEAFLMVGNSLKSDILPVVRIGGHAVHVPYHITWELERVSKDEVAATDFHHLGGIGELPGLLQSLGWHQNGDSAREAVENRP